MTPYQHDPDSHGFNVGIAKAYGVTEAIIYNHIIYWLKQNAVKGKNLHEGKFWMYETQQQMAAFLDYLTEEQIKKAIVRLLNSGILIKGNFNKNSFDRTSWYTISDQSIFQKYFTKAPYGAIDGSPGRDPKSHTAPCIYVQEEHQEENHKEQQQQQEVARPAALAAASFEKKQGQEPKGYVPTVYDLFRNIKISEATKIRLSKTYNADTVRNAIGWATSPLNNPAEDLDAYITFACKEGLSVKNLEKKKKAKETPYEKICKIFVHGEKYNNAECILKPDVLCFYRGQLHHEIKLDTFFTWKKVEDLCEKFQIDLIKPS